MKPTDHQLLNKIISSPRFNTTNETPPEERQQQDPVEQSPLKYTSSLFAKFERAGVLTEPFTLSSPEETLLLDIVRESQLVSCLTLFDLLFFDLHQQIKNLEKFVRPEDHSKATASLELFYGTVVESEKRNLVDLNSFLKG